MELRDVGKASHVYNFFISPNGNSRFAITISFLKKSIKLNWKNVLKDFVV